MKILSVVDAALPGVKIIRFARFLDARGYFAEPFRRSDMDARADLGDLRGQAFVQANESYSRPNVVRGLHFQWNPFMGKLVRTVRGHMVDIFLDIRKGSATLGKAAMHDMPTSDAADWSEWIWVPPGFAHGNFFPETTVIEYYCTGEYSQGCEAAICPLSKDIDWSLCDAALKARFDALAAGQIVISDKDRLAPTLQAWLADSRSDRFQFGQLHEVAT
jgi:dTDP-4-dehydrorhamnose 3,5-epimerase